MRKIFIWASPHIPSVEQLNDLEKQGTVVYLKEVQPELFNNLMGIKLDTNLLELAQSLYAFSASFTLGNWDDETTEDEVVLVQPAGNPAFQAQFGSLLAVKKMIGEEWVPDVLFAFSERKSTDQTQPDGSVKKVSVFEHKGWQTIKY